MPHKAHGVVVGDQIDAMTNSVGAKQQSIAYVKIRFVDFSGVNRKPDIAVLSAQLPGSFQKAQGVAFVIVFPTHHVYRNKDIAIVVHQRIGTAELFLGGRHEPEDGELQSHGHARCTCILLL